MKWMDLSLRKPYPRRNHAKGCFQPPLEVESISKLSTMDGFNTISDRKGNSTKEFSSCEFHTLVLVSG